MFSQWSWLFSWKHYISYFTDSILFLHSIHYSSCIHSSQDLNPSFSVVYFCHLNANQERILFSWKFNEQRQCRTRKRGTNPCSSWFIHWKSPEWEQFMLFNQTFFHFCFHDLNSICSFVIDDSQLWCSSSVPWGAGYNNLKKSFILPNHIRS